MDNIIAQNPNDNPMCQHMPLFYALLGSGWGLGGGFAASFGFGWMAIAGFHHASSASNYCAIMVQSSLGLRVFKL